MVSGESELHQNSLFCTLSPLLAWHPAAVETPYRALWALAQNPDYPTGLDSVILVGLKLNS